MWEPQSMMLMVDNLLEIITGTSSQKFYKPIRGGYRISKKLVKISKYFTYQLRKYQFFSNLLYYYYYRYYYIIIIIIIIVILILLLLIIIIIIVSAKILERYGTVGL